MPDLRAAEQFIAAGERLEARLMAAAIRSWQRARMELLEALLAGQSVAPVVVRVGRAVADAGAALSPVAAQEVERYLAAQLRALPVGVVPLLGAPSVSGEALAPLRSGLPAWQAATVGRFLTGAQQLAGDAPAAIAAALTAPGGAPGASAFVWALNGLQLAAEGALWQSLNGALGGAYRELDRRGSRDGQRFEKQALAAIDRRTTRCCLSVHGQIVALDQPFRTDGPPAYAGEQQQPPFHYRCRTVIALYHPAMEQVGPRTEQLRATARAELVER